jgi:eukaryotic-like serine/threonine-protein kinase
MVTMAGVGIADDEATVEYSTPVERIVAGRYRVRELLGRGGMASVYRADDESLGRSVAVKIFHAELAHALDARRQGEETSLLASLNHPGLVMLFDAVSDGDDSVLVMEYVDGMDLRVRMQSGPLDARAAALIGADIAGALAYIHGRGVVHRDVKPANILLVNGASDSNPAHAKLADFGIARLIDSTHLTATGSLIGTASYLSPEQAEGRAVGAPTDIYSLALSLLEGLTGERAFPGSAVESTVARLNRDPVVPNEFGSVWAELLRSGTARDAAARPTAEELARRLRQLAGPEATLVLPVAAPRVAGHASTDIPAAAMAAETAPTALFGSPPPDDAEARVTRPRVRGRSIAVVVALVIALVIVTVAAIGLWSLRPGQDGDATVGTTSPGDTTSVTYPVVDGDLGSHLEQLQKSVEP